MPPPVLAVCVSCNMVFDLGKAPECRKTCCRLCPLGHAAHDVPGWRKMPSLKATEREQEAGLERVLRDYVVR